MKKQVRFLSENQKINNERYMGMETIMYTELTYQEKSCQYMYIWALTAKQVKVSHKISASWNLLTHWCVSWNLKFSVLHPELFQQTEVIIHPYYWAHLLGVKSRGNLCDLWEHPYDLRYTLWDSYNHSQKAPKHFLSLKNIEELSEK